MSLSANLKAALRAHGANPVWLLRIALPTQVQYGLGPYASAASGLFEDRMLSLTGMGRTAAQDPQSRLAAVEATAEIEDKAQAFAMQLEGASGNSVFGATATVFLAEPTVAEADWCTLLSGRLVNAEMPRSYVWRLTLRPNDLALQGTFPRATITSLDWPAAAVESIGLPMPLLYGKHNSQGLTNTGAVPLLRVSATDYLLCYGRAKTIDRVYVEGVQQASGAWAKEYQTKSGRLCTVVAFTADPGESFTVTADAQGYDTANDGTGTVITDPATIIKHMLVNFVWGDHPGSGAWYADATAPVDATHFATAIAYTGARAYVGSMYLASQVIAQAHFEGLCYQWQLHPFWTAAGKLAILPIDNAEGSLYQDDPWIEQRHEVDESIALSHDDANRCSRVRLGYCYLAADGQYFQGLDVMDPSITDTATVALDVQTGASYAVAP